MSSTDYAKEHAYAFRAALVDLLRIPSISTQTAHAPDVERAAQWLIEAMTRIGMTARAYQADGYLPIVYGEWLGAGADKPTVLVYGHYDVQPAQQSDGWLTDPFTPTERDGKLYARGAVDSKSHVLIQLKAVESLLLTGGAPVNIKLMFEGEEESGSAHIFKFVADNPDLLRCDVCVVSDGSLPDVNQPVLDYGLRGLAPSMELIVTGPQRDLHSGHYGGTTHNPIHALAHILAGLHDAQGRVTVPGFYDGVDPLTDEERAVLTPIASWFESDWRTVTGAPQPWGDPDYRIHERIMVRPTLEFNGIIGGYTGEGGKTVIPSRASAKITCRLVPHQDPLHVFEAVRDHINRLTPPTVRAELLYVEDGSPAVVIDRHSEAVRAADAAYRKGWGVAPLYAREGGSIPVVSALMQHLDTQMVLMPFGYKGGGAHSTNEYVVWEMFHKGIDTMLYFYDEIAQRLHKEG